jgi:hypothetical protein
MDPDLDSMIVDQQRYIYQTVKKRFAIFQSPAGMSLAKLSLAGNNFSRDVTN